MQNYTRADTQAPNKITDLTAYRKDGESTLVFRWSPVATASTFAAVKIAIFFTETDSFVFSSLSRGLLHSPYCRRFDQWHVSVQLVVRSSYRSAIRSWSVLQWRPVSIFLRWHQRDSSCLRGVVLLWRGLKHVTNVECRSAINRQRVNSSRTELRWTTLLREQRQRS